MTNREALEQLVYDFEEKVTTKGYILDSLDIEIADALGIKIEKE